MNNVKREFDLYHPMCEWLTKVLKDKYKNQKCTITVVDAHAWSLDKVLTQYGIIYDYPQTVGLNIEIDVLGMVVWDNGKTELHFIEAKKTPLNLHDLGQLIVYCSLVDPSDAYLLSSAGMGSLDKVLNNLGREDLLKFGDGKKIKSIKVATWDVSRDTVDQYTIYPKI